MLNSIVPSARAEWQRGSMLRDVLSTMYNPDRPNFGRMLSDMHAATLNRPNTSPNVTIWFRCVLCHDKCVVHATHMTQTYWTHSIKLPGIQLAFFYSENDFSLAMYVVGCLLRHLCRCSLQNILYILYVISNNQATVQNQAMSWKLLCRYFECCKRLASNAFAQHNSCD